MAVAKKRKRMVYLRAIFSDEAGESRDTLQEYLQEAHGMLPMVGDREFVLRNKTWTGTIFQDRSDDVVFQFSTSVPGEEASTIPKNTDAAQANLNTSPPPDGFDFSDGDIICLVSGNNVFVLASGLRDAHVDVYLQALFTKAGLDERARHVVLKKSADLNRLEMIRSSGVKSLKLNVDISAPELVRMDRAPGANILKRLLFSFFSKDTNMAQCARMAQARFELTVTDGKVAGDQWLKQMAEEVLDEGSGYSIITKSGAIITESSLCISRTKAFEPFGKSVFLNDAIRMLEGFKRELISP